MTGTTAKLPSASAATQPPEARDATAPATPPESPIHHLAERYFAWTDTALRQLAEIAERDEWSGVGHEAAAEEAYGILHDLKGSGVLFGYDLMTHIADSGCALIGGRTAIDPDSRDVLRQHVDAMKLVMGRRIAGDGGEAGRRLLTKLAGLRTRTCGPG
ncbi:MAG: hypothetical protein JNM30_00660 [Rhodospirillales bacterium]|nr:hypothetical protein [Rhodospirillales bacterium]